MTAKTTNAAQQPALALFKTKAEILSACTTIHSTGQQLQTLMHKTACSVLQHFGKNKDTRVVLAMLNALPESVRKNALISWFEAFGQMTIREDKESKIITVLYAADKKTRLGDAMAKPFWKFVAKEGAAYEPLNFNEYVASQIKKLEKDLEKVPAQKNEDPRRTLLVALQAAQKAAIPTAEDRLNSSPNI